MPYNITGLKSNKEYDIAVYSDTSKRFIGSTNARTSANIQVDLSGFEPSCTYYVVYDKNGNLVDETTRIELDSNGKATNIPDGWYDYDNKIWANIKTVNNGLTTYWTYIPRYEYNIYAIDVIDIQFIPYTQTTPDPFYTIPESFKFGGKNLKGYWLSKYEVQGTID